VFVDDKRNFFRETVNPGPLDGVAPGICPGILIFEAKRPLPEHVRFREEIIDDDEATVPLRHET